MTRSLPDAKCHNSLSRIHQLPNELLSEILIHSLSCQSTVVSFKESHLVSLSSVCSLWRSIVTTDPRLWTHISLSDASGEPISPLDEEHIKTLLSRSCRLPLLISIDITDGERTQSLKACLRMLKAELWRCESIEMKTNCIAGWEDAFPLEGDMSSLKEMRVVSSLESTWQSSINISLFANTPPHLEVLHLNMEYPYLADLTHINPSSLKELSLRAYISHEDAFAFIRTCERLEKLDLELYADDDQAFETLIGEGEDDIGAEIPEGLEDNDEAEEPFFRPKEEKSFVEGIYCPSLKHLAVRGPSAIMLSCIIDAPSLETLHFTLSNDSETFALSYALLQGSQILPLPSDTSTPSSNNASSYITSRSASAILYPNLHSLQIEGEYHLAVPAEAIAAFVTSGAHTKLENFVMTRFCNTAEVLESLTSSSRSILELESSEVGSLTPDLLALRKLALVDSSKGQTYPSSSSLEEPITDLLRVNPGLYVEWRLGTETSIWSSTR